MSKEEFAKVMAANELIKRTRKLNLERDLRDVAYAKTDRINKHRRQHFIKGHK